MQSITVNRSVSDVFRTVANFREASQWQPDVQGVHLSDDHVRTGVIVTVVRSTRLLGWKLDLNADIIDYTPNKLIEYKGVLGRFAVRGSYSFIPSAGKTQVTETLNIRMGWLYAIWGPLMRTVMAGRTRRALEGLKQYLEARGTTSGEILTPPPAPDS